MGSSTISRKGIFIPIYTVLEQCIIMPNVLQKKKIFVIQDDQIDKRIVFSLKDNKVVLSINHSPYLFYKKSIWYDGEKLIKSRSISNSVYNTIEFNIFKKGCLESLQDFLLLLCKEYPEIKNTKEFKKLLNEEIA